MTDVAGAHVEQRDYPGASGIQDAVNGVYWVGGVRLFKHVKFCAALATRNCSC